MALNIIKYPMKDDLLNVFIYNPILGCLFRDFRNNRKYKYKEPIKRVGYLNEDGYERIKFKHKSYYTNRLIWIMHHGDIPEGYYVDHINNIRNDNRIENLQLLTARDNTNKRTINKNNTSGYRGVSFSSSDNKWRVTYMLEGKKKIKRFIHKACAIAYRKIVDARYGFSVVGQTI